MGAWDFVIGILVGLVNIFDCLFPYLAMLNLEFTLVSF